MRRLVIILISVRTPQSRFELGGVVEDRSAHHHGRAVEHQRVGRRAGRGTQRHAAATPVVQTIEGASCIGRH